MHFTNTEGRAYGASPGKPTLLVDVLNCTRVIVDAQCGAGKLSGSERVRNAVQVQVRQRRFDACVCGRDT
jgi:hypothetical protein